jgi:5-formyltetrahydrofolate cyclo-ligase
LHCFIPIPKFNEINTYLIFERIWDDHPQITTVVPRVSSGTGKMHNVRFTSETELAENAWNIPEPIHDDFVQTEEIDMVLVPLLCFDLSGKRVGYGKGFYDRFLSACRDDCVKIGLSYFPPTRNIDDVHKGDVPIDLCVTPDVVYRFG